MQDGTEVECTTLETEGRGEVVAASYSYSPLRGIVAVTYLDRAAATYEKILPEAAAPRPNRRPLAVIDRVHPYLSAEQNCMS